VRAERLMELAGATILVTGAESAIGSATVEELTAGGARVVPVGEIDTAGARAAALERAPGLTHLVVAGGSSPSCPLEEVTLEHWHEVFTAQAQALFFMLQAACPLLPPGGAVVNVTSVAGKTGRSPEVTVYSASAAAALSLTRSFANAYGSRGVRVNAICTGVIETPDNERYLREVAATRSTTVEEVAAKRFGQIPLARAGTPLECARVIRHLLSDDAGYVTGQAINLTGGFHNY
jgi:NAD(P)-dependent dehydrogenase (short-subunit alcohol dehydrogenase family)